MPANPQIYRSLPSQVAARIAGEMAAGTWADWLPSERSLAETLQVSRKTLRKAVARLQHEGLIETVPGSGHRIRNRSPAERIDTAIGLLMPASLENLRPFTTMWVDELRTLLFESHVKLQTFSGHRFFSSRPAKALARLVKQNSQACWILAHSNPSIQRWFLDNCVPCLIAGSCHPGLPLPSVDIDHFGVCRHAAGAMLGRGHRRIAFFTKESQRAGDIAAEAGFIDGVRRSSHSEVQPLIMRHNGTTAGAVRILARMFEMPSPPTAILVNDPAFYLTMVTFLAQRGLRVPADLSLISRDDDVFLPYLVPAPARYTCSPKTFAKRMLPLVLALARGEPAGNQTQSIEPKFVPGQSLATPPG